MAENKGYSRDVLQRGRIRVRLVDDEGTPLLAEVDTRVKLYKAIAKFMGPIRKKQEELRAQKALEAMAKMGGAKPKKDKADKGKGKAKGKAKAKK